MAKAVRTVSVLNTITHNGTTYGIVTSPYTGKVWLDRNLGASQVCTSLDDALCYGDYYQWGRNSDGHQESNSSTTTTLATDVNNAGSSFILSPNGSHDWTSTDSNGSQRYTNWSATDGNSVCPVGFRIPYNTEMNAEVFDAGSAQISNSSDAFNSFLKLPVAGQRQYAFNIPIQNAGSFAYLWLLNSNNSNLIKLFVTAGDAYTTSAAVSASGNSIRCIKD